MNYYATTAFLEVIMWIRFENGDLVNMDVLDCVYYDPDKDTTCGVYRGVRRIIGTGNTVQYIAAELRKLSQLVEVY